MNIVKTIALGSAGLLMAGCVSGFEGGPRDDKTVDAGFRGNKDLSQWQAGIWVDPTSCDHWIIDDGIEGYLSARLDPDGKPVCSGVAPPNTAIGPFKGADDVSNPL